MPRSAGKTTRAGRSARSWRSSRILPPLVVPTRRSGSEVLMATASVRHHSCHLPPGGLAGKAVYSDLAMPGRADDQLGRFIERVVLPPGWRVLHEPSVESTNDLAREAAR